MGKNHDLGTCMCSRCNSIRRKAFRPAEAIGIAPQPLPKKNDAKPIVDLVIEDMIARKKEGISRYGTPLQANNGRDALIDAYHEALGLCMYLRQAIEERQC